MDLMNSGLKFLLLACAAALLSGCISYEPRVLVPALTLSADDVSLRTATADLGNQINFGLEVTVNESDSLLNIEILPGVRVRTVNPGGPAAAAGIQPGDIVLAVDDIATDHPDSLAAIRQQNSSGIHRFTVRRNTTVFEASVAGQMSATAAPQELYRADPIATRAGYRTELVDIRGQSAIPAARVVALFPGSPLPAAGIAIGDLVLALNGSNLNSAQGLITRLNQEFELGTEVVMTVFAGEAVTDKTVSLWDPGRRISRLTIWPLLNYASSLSPPSDNLTILDLWLFAVYRYNRVDGERTHSILGLINFSSNYGELTEDAN